MSVPISSAISATFANSAPNGFEHERDARPPLPPLRIVAVDNGADLLRDGLRASGAGDMQVSTLGRCRRDEEPEALLDFVLWLRRGGGDGMAEGEKYVERWLCFGLYESSAEEWSVSSPEEGDDGDEGEEGKLRDVGEPLEDMELWDIEQRSEGEV